MGGRRHMIRSRVTLAVIGMLIIGGFSAFAGALTTPGPKGASLAQTRGQSTATATTGLPTPTATSPQQTDDSQPTAIVANPTDTPVSQGTTLQGTITAIDSSAQTFVVTRGNGSHVTVAVDNSTAYSGFADRFSQLSTGLFARLTGQTLANGSFLAATIDTSTDN